MSPFSYAEGEAGKLYTVDPWPYFSPDLAEAYQASLQRVVAPRWNTIDQDVPGTAAGNWFLDGTLGYSGKSVDTFRLADDDVVRGARRRQEFLRLEPSRDRPPLGATVEVDLLHRLVER